MFLNYNKIIKIIIPTLLKYKNLSKYDLQISKYAYTQKIKTYNIIKLIHSSLCLEFKIKLILK